MTLIHLIRHGQTNWNVEGRIQGQTDSILTEIGQAQAVDAGEALKNHRFDAAYSSTSIRALDTAKSILAHHQTELRPTPDLLEIHFGSWEGRLYAELEADDPENHDYFFNNPAKFNVEGVETFYQVQTRAMATIDKIAAAHPQQTVLLVSHGLYIRAILNHIQGTAMEAFWQGPRMTNCCHSIIQRQDNGAFTIQQFAHPLTDRD